MTDKSSPPNVQEVEDRILAFIRRELLPPETTVERDEDLLSDLLDSVAVLRLATFVDEEFQISTQPADFVIENFQTAAVIAAYVCRAAIRADHSTPTPGP